MKRRLLIWFNFLLGISVAAAALTMFIIHANNVADEIRRLHFDHNYKDV